MLVLRYKADLGELFRRELASTTNKIFPHGAWGFREIACRRILAISSK
jgi:hypothetical protein